MCIKKKKIVLDSVIAQLVTNLIARMKGMTVLLP
jgi:hypothetical protein